ncbi:MAG: PD-(D/E)XK nuclease family protein, partial [Acidobacteriota bacterium]
YRRQLDAPLATQDERVVNERLLLRIAAGAARSRLIVSYPNLDMLQGRTRVPSFYALDLLRAAEGSIPDLRHLETQAARGSQSLLGWPAPRDRASAIDDAEYDLSVLEPFLRRQAPAAPGRGRFLLEANPRLTRSLRARWSRWRPGFSAADGVVAPDPETLQGLERFQLSRRSYSPTALQRFAACPYRFLLYSVHGLKPREEAIRLEQLDPLTRGSLIHEIQFELFCALEARDLLSFEASEEVAISEILAETVEKVADRYYEDLAPAIERVWRSGIEELHTDLRGWIRSLIAAGEPWRPARFEMMFGLRRGTAPADMRGSDEAFENAEIAGGKRLHGAIDLVEEGPGGRVLRVTDHKTGKSPELRRLAVGGGKTLQPALYGMAAEELLGKVVESGRLFFCTRRGRYETLEVPLDEAVRQAVGEVLETIDRAIADGFMPAAPDRGECKWCDYNLICGPHAETQVQRKHPQRLIPLTRLREMP